MPEEINSGIHYRCVSLSLQQNSCEFILSHDFFLPGIPSENITTELWKFFRPNVCEMRFHIGGALPYICKWTTNWSSAWSCGLRPPPYNRLLLSFVAWSHSHFFNGSESLPLNGGTFNILTWMQHASTNLSAVMCKAPISYRIDFELISWILHLLERSLLSQRVF